MLDDKFRAEIDKALPRAGFSDRSSFIRNAVYKRLAALGVEIPLELTTAPSRAGKGGPKKKRKSRNVTVTVRGDNHGAVVGKKSTTTFTAPDADPKILVLNETSAECASKAKPKK